MTRSRADYVVAKDRANLTAGDVVKMTCEVSEMTQAELSRRSGVSPSNLSDIVHGRRPVGKAVAEKLAKALNISPAFILFAGTSARDGADICLSHRGKRESLLLNAIRTLKNAEKKRVERHRAAMRSAINLITKALEPDSVKNKVTPSNAVVKSVRAHKQRTRQSR